MQDKYQQSPLKAFGPLQLLAKARWAPSSSTTQTLTEAMGVSSITRNLIGNYTINMVSKFQDIDAQIQVVENDTTTLHQTRVESINASAGTITVSHKSSSLSAYVPTVTAGFSLANISGGASSAYTTAPLSGTVVKVYGTIANAITVANAGITTAIRSGAGAFTTITNGGFTVVQAASAAGDQFVATPTALRTVVAGDALRISTDGGSTTACQLTGQFVIQPTTSGVLLEPSGSDTVDQLCCYIWGREVA